MSAPTAKLAAEVSAAWIGRALGSRGYAEFVLGMCAQSIVSHQLLGDLRGERGIQSALDVDGRQFPLLAFVVGLQLRPFQCEVGLFDVRL
jgi:hypothetical protein